MAKAGVGRNAGTSHQKRIVRWFLSMASTEPGSQTDLRALLLDYLDFYRATIIETIGALPDDESTRSRLPSGWTPAQLFHHLAFKEQRWFVACIQGVAVEDL